MAVFIFAQTFAHLGLAAQENVTYAYDEAGRLVSAVYSDGTTNAAICYQYDPNGNITNRVSLAPNDTATDNDGDTLGDLLELVYFGNLAEDGGGDPDADGLANSNEFVLGANPTLTNTDGDAQADADEFIAGTGLNDPGSYFDLDDAARTGTAVRLQWEAVAGRTYQIEVATGLTAGVTWTNRGPEQPAASNTVQESSEPLATNEYYRVKVRLTE